MIKKCLEPCPVCGNVEWHLILQRGVFKEDHTERVFDIVQCHDCGLGRTEPLLSYKELEPFYTDEYWHQTPALPGINMSLISRLQQRFIDVRLYATIKPILEKMTKGSRILDVGCGSGDVLRLMVKSGLTVSGVEPAKQAAEFAQRTFGSNVIQGTLEESAYPEGAFDGATLLHVLEHVPDPFNTLVEICRVIKPCGLILIEVPNITSWGFRVFRERWHPLDIPFHLYHFSPYALEKLVQRVGFRIKRRSYFSARASCASWALSLFPSLDPRRLRRIESKNRATTFKLIYLAVQLLTWPIAFLSATVKHGDVVSILAEKHAT